METSHNINRTPSMMSPRPTRHKKAPAHAGCCVLVVIDNRPLRDAVWHEYLAAQKSFDKALSDIKRHEQIDDPSFHAWMHETFPQLLTALRELRAEVMRQEKIWVEQRRPKDAPVDDISDHMRQGEDSDGDSHRPQGDDTHDDKPLGDRSARERTKKTGTGGAKDLYRRMVQHLHPDRGGAWTPDRARLWHEVQKAWEARDGDWLARLEKEYESDNDTFSPASPISRLRRAISELVAARRDTARKLRAYRKMDSWRFSLNPKKSAIFRRKIEDKLRHEHEQVRHHLDYLNRAIAAWEVALIHAS